MHKQKNSIPKQTDGASSDTSAKIRLPSVALAISHFQTVRSRLLNISEWEKLSGKKFASFQLTDPSGKDQSREPEKGDYIRINIPGPGNKSGDGYDWVRIEDIDRKESKGIYEFLAIMVRPAKSPLSKEHITAHFFKKNATSTFIVKRHSNVIVAEVHGRNEKPNTRPHGIIKRVRNLLVGVGAMLGFSKIQWKNLVEGLVQKNN
jgi:hypothetical protein